jgi:hypothetical protein
MLLSASRNDIADGVVSPAATVGVAKAGVGDKIGTRVETATGDAGFGAVANSVAVEVCSGGVERVGDANGDPQLERNKTKIHLRDRDSIFLLIG